MALTLCGITKQFLKHFSVLETQVLELSNINQGRREI